MQLLAELSFLWAVIQCSWAAFKGLDQKTDDGRSDASRLSSLALLGCLHLFQSTPLAWAAASLVPGYHLARAGLHLLLAHDQDGQVAHLLLGRLLVPAASRVEHFLHTAMLPRALQAVAEAPQHLLELLFPSVEAFHHYHRPPTAAAAAVAAGPGASSTVTTTTTTATTVTEAAASATVTFRRRRSSFGASKSPGKAAAAAAGREHRGAEATAGVVAATVATSSSSSSLTAVTTTTTTTTTSRRSASASTMSSFASKIPRLGQAQQHMSALASTAATSSLPRSRNAPPSSWSSTAAAPRQSHPHREPLLPLAFVDAATNNDENAKPRLGARSLSLAPPSVEARKRLRQEVEEGKGAGTAAARKVAATTTAIRRTVFPPTPGTAVPAAAAPGPLLPLPVLRPIPIAAPLLQQKRGASAGASSGGSSSGAVPAKRLAAAASGPVRARRIPGEAAGVGSSSGGSSSGSSIKPRFVAGGSSGGTISITSPRKTGHRKPA